MEYSIVVNDETATGKILNQIILKLEREITTVEEIIRTRVTREVEAYNSSPLNIFKGLVQPRMAEMTLNGFKMPLRKKIDLDEQIKTALTSFKENGFFILIGDEQYSELNAEVLLEKETTVSFVKLTPLVGG
ncbi:hypothetical protein QQ020_13685 [Fulvivirgaceae bacterium BMA12]|uniref:Phage protein n=1 Tax=Agaribacillus aureus TaxID=3051825 RepID=A0ABT8L5X8_9BACT|nr:hypothetical protein [Fulvivirgaceae bacterium BMA12]